MNRRKAASRSLALAVVAVLTGGCTTGQKADPGTPAPSADSPTTSATAADSSDTAEPAFAGAWRDATADALGETADWTNKVEVADLDHDGDVDLLFANGGDYESPGTSVASRVFLNSGDGTFEDATQAGVRADQGARAGGQSGRPRR